MRAPIRESRDLSIGHAVDDDGLFQNGDAEQFSRRNVLRPGREGQQQHRRGRRRERHPRAWAGCGRGRVQRQDAAADLGAGGVGLLGGQNATGEVALDLGQLVAIDREIVGVARRGALPPHQKRHQQNGHGQRGEADQRDGETDAHARASGSAEPSSRDLRRRRSSALKAGGGSSRRRCR